MAKSSTVGVSRTCGGYNNGRTAEQETWGSGGSGRQCCSWVIRALTLLSVVVLRNIRANKIRVGETGYLGGGWLEREGNGEW